jgi:YVTN family beta-propeller protein
MMKLTTAILVLVGLSGAVSPAQETPSPALLVLHKGDNAMAIVDPSTGEVMGRVPTGQDPHELVVSDDGKLAIATNYAGPGPRGGNTLSVIDIAARKEIHRVDLAPLSRPHGLWFSDGKAYFTAEGSMAIARYDPKTNRVDWLLGLGQDRTHMIVVSKDGKTLFTANVNSNTISIIEQGGGPGGRPGGPGGPPPGGPGGPPPDGPPPGGFGGPPPDGPPPGGFGGPPGGFGGPPGGFGGPPGGFGGPPGGFGGPPGGRGGPPPGGPGGGPGWRQTVIPVGRGPEGFDVSPDGKQLWAAHSGDGGISIIDIGSKKVIATIDAGARRSNRLKFTPDGKRALVSAMGGGDLIVLDTATRSVTKRIPLGRGISGILIPPDGARAYVALTGDNAIAVIDLKTLAEVGRLKTGPGPDGMAWLPPN